MSSWMWRGRVGNERVSDRLLIWAENHGGGAGMGSSMMFG